MLANANQERQGQYFTPGYVSDADARMIVGLLREREVVNIGDISCGSGVQLLSAADAARWIGEDPGKRLFLTGADLNPLCADMCYLQLTLNGLSASIFHSDTLAGRVYDGRVTPRAIAMAAGKQQRLDRTSMTGRFDLLLQGRKLAGTAGA